MYMEEEIKEVKEKIEEMEKEAGEFRSLIEELHKK